MFPWRADPLHSCACCFSPLFDTGRSWRLPPPPPFGTEVLGRGWSLAGGVSHWAEGLGRGGTVTQAAGDTRGNLVGRFQEDAGKNT